MALVKLGSNGPLIRVETRNGAEQWRTDVDGFIASHGQGKVNLSDIEKI